MNARVTPHIGLYAEGAATALVRANESYQSQQGEIGGLTLQLTFRSSVCVQVGLKFWCQQGHEMEQPERTLRLLGLLKPFPQ
jgi:hypothetical protein